MTSIKRLPTYHEVVELSNRDLTTLIRKALNEVQMAKKQGENSTEKEKIYWAFQEERLKRLNLGKNPRFALPTIQIKPHTSTRTNT